MKGLILQLLIITGLAGYTLAGLSIPIAGGVGLYEWAILDEVFKLALWDAAVLWFKLAVSGALTGLFSFMFVSVIGK